jgi:hypothetical protein
MKKKLTQSEAGKLGNVAAQETFRTQKQARIDTYNQNPTLCQECNDILQYEKRTNKFCNTSCAASFNNRGHVKNGTVFPEEKACKICNEQFATNRQNRATEHCKKCIENTEYKNKVKNCENISDLKTDRSRKIYLIEKHGVKCFTCENTEWNDKPIPIQLDHIDGNHENNSEENLRLLCPNCHAQTDTYAGKNVNKNKGRPWRRKYYKSAEERKKEG